jgi:NAD(P)H-dependent flavin oxidoreductase YrpB (nitropropane dioxygenase family)
LSESSCDPIDHEPKYARARKAVNATSRTRARYTVNLVAAGVHADVAQGYEAGGHRGVFDPDADDDRLGTMAPTRLLVPPEISTI